MFECPSKILRRLPPGNDQSFIIQSPPPPDASNLPSGLIAKASTESGCASMVLRRPPSGNDQSLNILYPLPDASNLPSGLIARARTTIQRERDDAVDELRREFADLTILAAEKVIDRSLDKEAHRQVIDKVLEESTTPKKD